jgi:hypothetical protein
MGVDTNIAPVSAVEGVPAVDATHTGAVQGAASIAVQGHSANGRGVSGSSHADYAMRAHSDESSGIRATSYDGAGVEGECITRPDGTTGGPAGSGGTAAGVSGGSVSGIGVHGASQDGVGVQGEGLTAGVVGLSAASVGVSGAGKTGGSFDGTFEGVHAVSHDQTAAGVAGYNDNTGPGIYGKSTHGAAAWFDGKVHVTGDLEVTGDVVLLGTVMVLAGEDRVRSCDHPYDRRVAGVISGAGGYRPAVVMDRQADPARRALALTGKVWCKVDAGYGPIELGDPLTTSATPGHAMRADDQARSFGAVIGKALAGLTSGRGLVPVLVAQR